MTRSMRHLGGLSIGMGYGEDGHRVELEREMRASAKARGKSEVDAHEFAPSASSDWLYIQQTQDHAFAARIWRDSDIARAMFEQLPPGREMPVPSGRLVSAMEGADRDAVETYPAAKLRWGSSRKAVVSIRDMRVQARFAYFGTVLADAFGDHDLRVGITSVPQSCAPVRALAIAGARWALLIAPLSGPNAPGGAA